MHRLTTVTLIDVTYDASKCQHHQTQFSESQRMLLNSQSMIDLYLIVSVVILTLSEATTTFERTLDSNGSTTCAISAPSLVIRIDQLVSFLPEVGCLPPEVRCGWVCTRDTSCSNYNYKQGLTECEIYHYAPTICSFQQGCSHLRVNNSLFVCQSVA